MSSSSKVAVPPSLANQNPTVPLPASLQSSLLAALYSSSDTIPRLQTVLSTALDSPTQDTQAEANTSFTAQINELLLTLIRNGSAPLFKPPSDTDADADTTADQALIVRRDATGSIKVDEAALSEYIMDAVRRAKQPNAVPAVPGFSTRQGQGQSGLVLDGRARREIVRVVREEVGRVAVVRDEGVDTPFGRMY